MLLQYDNQVYETKNYPKTWPAQTKLKLSPDQPTLLMFIHPKCPCTRASLEELNRLLTNFPDRLAVEAVFFKAEDTVCDWHTTDLWRKASQMHIKTYVDEDAEQAKLFSAKSSGLVLLYDTKAKLIFAGGLTASRGHEGDNIGRSSIERYLRSNTLTYNSSPSFGCPIF